MARAYDVQTVEEKWQQRWADARLYEVDADDPRPPQYVLCMYPYPSGAAHQGHVRNYTFGDLLVRHRTMQGYAVLSPFGFDSFGLPAENAAIKTGEHPRIFTEARIAELKASVKRLGCRSTTGAARSAATTPTTSAGTRPSSCACSRPDLAYRAQRAGQLVPGLPDGARQRAGARRRDLRALRRRGRPARARAVVLPHHRLRRRAPRRPRRPRLARAGQGDAAQLDRALRGRGVRPPRGGRPTTVPAGLHHPPRHQLRHDLRRARAGAPARRRASRRRAQRAAVEDLLAGHGGQERARPHVRGRRRGGAGQAGRLHRRPRGQPLQRRADPGVRGRLRPLRYGTGAIMAVPAEDERDWAFAQAHGLPVVRTVQPPEGLRRRGVDRRRREDQLGLPRRPGRGGSQGAGHRRGSRSRGSASAPSTTGCGTGWCRASATGAAPSRSSTAPTTGSWPCPTTSCPCSPPTTSSSCRPASPRSPATSTSA